jgi:hypothetical protein
MTRTLEFLPAMAPAVSNRRQHTVCTCARSHSLPSATPKIPCSVGLESAAGHVLHAKAGLQVFDAVRAGVAALAIPFHRRRRVFIGAIAGDYVILRY